MNLMPHSQMCVCMCVVVVFFFLKLCLKENSCPGRKGHLSTRATLDEPTFHTFSYKTWRNVYMRIKKLAWLGWPRIWLGHPFVMAGRVTLLPGPTFLHFSFSSSFLTLFVCFSVCNGTCLLSSNPLLGTVDILSLLTPLSVQRERALRDT